MKKIHESIFHSAGGFFKTTRYFFFPVVTINYFYIIVAAVEYWVIIIKVEKMYINTFCVMFCLFFQEDKWFLHKSLLSFKSNICNINKCCFFVQKVFFVFKTPLKNLILKRPENSRLGSIYRIFYVSQVSIFTNKSNFCITKIIFIESIILYKISSSSL